ncbi:MAG: hypothetical protein KAJ33_02880 [Thermoplasmata archaeon]|nr:hypothetical protein [Thermoplasmata archaeon]MCK5397176.1 hypothetical protein [Thermoplasmata archaeon]
MNMGSSERLVFSVVLGFAVIFNLIGSSYLEFYPTSLLIGVAFAVGIAMAVGSTYLLVKEPERFVKRRNYNAIHVDRPVAVKRANIAAC